MNLTLGSNYDDWKLSPPPDNTNVECPHCLWIGDECELNLEQSEMRTFCPHCTLEIEK